MLLGAVVAQPKSTAQEFMHLLAPYMVSLERTSTISMSQRFSLLADVSQRCFYCQTIQQQKSGETGEEALFLPLPVILDKQHNAARLKYPQSARPEEVWSVAGTEVCICTRESLPRFSIVTVRLMPRS